MRAKSWILLVIALGCGMVASVAISQVVLDQRKGAAPQAMTEILVTERDLTAGSKITKENVKLEKWPSDRVPPGAVTDLKTVDGQFVKQPMFQGEPLVPKKLSATSDNIANNIPEGYMVFDFAVDEKSGGVGYVKPGNRIDVFGFFEKGRGIPQTKSVRVIEDVSVFMVDGNATRESGEGAKASRTVQLLIRESQYEALTTAANLGKLRLALRRDAAKKATTDNGEEFLDWVRSGEGAATTAPVNTDAVASVPQVPKVAQNEMVVITPSGLTKYQWTDDSQIPTPVDEKAKGSADHSSAGGAPAGNMVWNPSTGQWTTGGLTTDYPPESSSNTADSQADASPAKNP